MSTTLNINDIKDANSNISAMVLTQKWAQVFQKYALEDTEALTDDPANSFNVFLHLTAQGAAKMMYEQAARINEVNESTAILPKSLLHKLSSDELTGIFGFPSSTTLAFCVKKNDILSYSVLENEATGDRKLIINKNFKATFESHPEFTLPYDIIINAKPLDDGSDNYNIYANYDMPSVDNDGMRNVYGIYNPYISSREIRYDNDSYIAFFIRIYQIYRKEIDFYVSDPNTADTVISFYNKLVGFEVFRTSAATKSTSLMRGFVEGTALTSPNCYNYSYDYKRSSNNLNISFSKMNDSTAIEVGDTIKIVIYTTSGEEGNIEFPYMLNNLNQLMINYNQDLSDKYQNAMLNIICLAFARDKNSKGGKDQLTIDEIRQKIINKKYSRDILITLNEVKNKAAEYGLDAYKEEHDVINMYLRGIDKLTYKDMILSTGMNNFYFKLNDKKELVNGTNYYLIEPTDVFVYDKDSKKFNYKPRINEKDPSKSLESYNQYVELYNSVADVEKIMQASFPFYMRFENTRNPKVQIYDMDVNDVQFLSAVEYNEKYALDKLDVSTISITRNPYMGARDGNFDKDASNTYYVRFIAYTGSNTLNKIYQQCHETDNRYNYVNSRDEDDYNKQYITFSLKMIGSASNNTYQIDPTRVQIVNTETMREDGYIMYQATITTNNYISDDKKIHMTGIRNVNISGGTYNSLVPIDTTIKFELTGKFNVNDDSTYCIKYESDSVKLVDYLTDYFGIDFDINTEINGYETYEQDVPDTYKEVEFMPNLSYNPELTDPNDKNYHPYEPEVDDNGNFIKNNGIIVYKILHNIGDPIYNYTEVLESEIANGPIDGVEYYTKIDSEAFTEYTLVENISELGFVEGVKYYTRALKYKHFKGEYKYYNSKNELVDEPDDVASESVLNHLKDTGVSYIGIMKNVSWINRLYFASENMYEKIRDLYKDLIDRIDTIKSLLFDGGLFRAGLKRTSGNSKKYKAYIMSTGELEYLKNIAIKMTLRVKFKDNDSLDYKTNQVIEATTNYIKNLGNNNLTIDKLFEDIKSAVPNIDYINIVNINDYYNGSVQTIINDTSVSDEILTVSQKLTTDENGDVDFEPDITVNVVNSELD